MLGLDPRLIALFSIMFIALGIFNILTGRRRLQQAQMQGAKVRWYKQIGILTGIEYVLLALAFLLNISITYHWLPQSLSIAVLPIYLVVLIASGVLAGVVIFQGLTNSRARRGVVARPVATTKTQAKQASYEVENLSPQERAENTQKRRERRQKAAAARRRRAGKA